MSNKGMPSLLALLGLVAVAGYQNRDKLRDMIADAGRGRRRLGSPTSSPGSPALQSLGSTSSPLGLEPGTRLESSLTVVLGGGVPRLTRGMMIMTWCSWRRPDHQSGVPGPISLALVGRPIMVIGIRAMVSRVM